MLLVGVNPGSIDLAKALRSVGIEPILADNNWRAPAPGALKPG